MEFLLFCAAEDLPDAAVLFGQMPTQPVFAGLVKWVVPLGAPPTQTDRRYSRRDLLFAARPNWTDSDCFGHRNGSVRWRCP
jgi:hypothetical protein